MSPEQWRAREVLHARCLALIERLRDGREDAMARDTLLSDLAEYQKRWVAPYARFCGQRPAGPLGAPALPTDAFRFARISSRDAAEDVRVFQSSGTTQQSRSRHAFADLSLYDAAAHAAARYALFPDLPRMTLLILAPPESELMHSSLSYMLARFVQWFGDVGCRYLWPVGEGHGAELEQALTQACAANAPVALLGTSFAFVHARDALGGKQFRLPPKSRIMQTGGFKGRSREVAPDAMRALLSESYGVHEDWIVAEYGMTELSSQLYETTLRQRALSLPVGPRRLWAPGWLRVTPMAGDGVTPVPAGQTGLLRMDDAANLDSVCAIQTADLGALDEHGASLFGRASEAVERGCSITADQLLRGGGR